MVSEPMQKKRKTWRRPLGRAAEAALGFSGAHTSHRQGVLQRLGPWLLLDMGPFQTSVEDKDVLAGGVCNPCSAKKRASSLGSVVKTQNGTAAVARAEL